MLWTVPALLGAVWQEGNEKSQSHRAQSSRAGPKPKPKCAKGGDAQRLRDYGGPVSASSWICETSMQEWAATRISFSYFKLETKLKIVIKKMLI